MRKLNQDFLNLADQTTRLETCSSKVGDWNDIPLQSDQRVQECRKIQNVLESLHKNLVQACPNHSAHFRLDSQHIDGSDKERSLVRFTMGFAHCESSAAAEPVWITIDTTFEELVSQGNDMSLVPPKTCKAIKTLSTSLKREVAEPSTNSKRLKTKSVKFTIPPSSSNSAAGLILSATFTMSLPNFCAKHDLCSRLRERGTCTPENKYIGYLEKPKHLVYFAPPISTCNTMASLAQIISQVSKDSTRAKFLQYDMLRLARKLASAVLQFHATPVLKDSWRGDNIIFFGNAGSIEVPHIAVRVGNGSVGHDQIVEPTKIIQNVVRNPYLFNLGIVLIELAYQKPIQALREEEDLENGKETKLTDFFAAKRLEKMIDTSMGVTYANIVRKCLDCDFGEGKDLKSPALQAVFFKDVVCELERLEQAFAKLQLGS